MCRPLATAAALTLALAVAACGSGDSAGSPVDSVRAYNRAVADGDGERACGRLSADAQRELQQSTQGSIRGSCRQVIELLAAFYDDATKERLRTAEVKAEPEGDQATARFTSPVAVGGPDREQTYELRRVDGDWKIASLGIVQDGLGSAP
jgi:hypothetical protein